MDVTVNSLRATVAFVERHPLEHPQDLVGEVLVAAPFILHVHRVEPGVLHVPVEVAGVRGDLVAVQLAGDEVQGQPLGVLPVP